MNKNVSLADCPPGARTKDRSGRCCVFPFKYKGRTYNSCTKSDSFIGRWCSFEAVFKRDWAYCSKNKCNFSWDIHISIFLFPFFQSQYLHDKKYATNKSLDDFLQLRLYVSSFYRISKLGKNISMKGLQFFLVVLTCRWWSVWRIS